MEAPHLYSEDLANGIVRFEVGDTNNDKGRTAYHDVELQEFFQVLHDDLKNQEKVTPWVLEIFFSDSAPRHLAVWGGFNYPLPGYVLLVGIETGEGADLAAHKIPSCFAIYLERLKSQHVADLQGECWWLDHSLLLLIMDPKYF